MKILFFSDLHLHAWEDFSYILPSGESSRLQDLLDVLGRITAIAQKYECDYVVFAGDMFHHPRSIVTRVYQQGYMALEQLANNVEQLIIIAGNHDLALFQNSQATSLYPLKNLPNTKIVLDPECLTDDRTGHSIFAMPYKDDSNTIHRFLSGIKSTGGILVSHCGLTEAAIGPNEINIEAPLNLNDLKPLKLDAAFFGHYHKAQDFADNVHVIGSPVQHNMLDRGDKRGVMIYDSINNETKRIWLKGPQFHLFELADKKDFNKLQQTLPELKDGYVRVLLKTKTIVKDQITAARKGRRACLSDTLRHRTGG